jgi:hypothetical protein
MPGSDLSWSAVAVLRSRISVAADGLAEEPLVVVAAEEAVVLPLPAGDIVAEPVDFEDGAEAVLPEPFCVLFPELADDEEDFVEPDEPDVDCACSPGADIVKRTTATESRPNSRVRTFMKPPWVILMRCNLRSAE